MMSSPEDAVDWTLFLAGCFFRWFETTEPPFFFTCHWFAAGTTWYSAMLRGLTIPPDKFLASALFHSRPNPVLLSVRMPHFHSVTTLSSILLITRWFNFHFRRALGPPLYAASVNPGGDATQTTQLSSSSSSVGRSPSSHARPRSDNW